MTNIRRELIHTVLNKAFILTDESIYNNSENKHEFRKKTILADESLTEYEKLEAIKRSTRSMDYFKLLENEGTKRICENCQEECLATLYCEYCVRNHLKSNFSN
jgi:hypothetical protein